MPDLTLEAKSAVQKLMQSDEQQLYEELGMRVKAYRSDLSVGASFAPQITYSAQLMGPLDDLRLFGKEYFKRVNRQAYELICGSGLKDTEDRKKLENAFHIGPADAAAFLATLLVAHLAMSAAAAAVVAVLIIRLFFRPAQEAMCQVWATKLDSGEKSKTAKDKKGSAKEKSRKKR